jgi:hypothetical protein
MKNKAVFFLILYLFSGCIGFSTKEKIINNYYLIATDSEEQLSLSYCDPNDKNGCIGIIGATVFSVGYNDTYIIAKQHPSNNRSITNYFLLPINNKDRHWGDNFGLIGPLTVDQFNEKKKELNISESLKFTIVKDNLK